MTAAWAGLWSAEPGYLNTASYGLPPVAGFAALQAALDEWRRGATSWEGWAASVETARAGFAHVAGVAVDDVFTCAAVSEMAGLVAAALPDGARVLVPEGEFTSIVFPWAVHADRGVTVREVPLQRLADSVGAGVDLVAFSAVSSATGELADVPAVVAAARSCGALTLVDTTQATGWLPIPLAGVDVVVCGAYKWLMSPRGTAFGVLRPELAERLRPLHAGWFAGADPHSSYYGLPARLAPTARRFDVSPAWHCWVGAAATLDVIAGLGVDRIREHDVALANRFRAGRGLPPGNSAIVSVHELGSGSRLAAAGIRAAERAGALRVSFHAYNTEDDVDAALAALSD